MHALSANRYADSDVSSFTFTPNIRVHLLASHICRLEISSSSLWIERLHTMDSQPDSLERTSSSLSQTSKQSQTAQDYIASQLSLEADAREALPYQFDTCTKPLGPLRQSIYACLTCTPPPASPHQQFTPAGVCYSCSISCHGEHNLVELFAKRDFVCDCGSTRIANSGTPCALRVDEATGAKGVKGEAARVGNKYNQNFAGKFCGCGEEYDPEKEKGTMFQCLGLGHVTDGGCGEDWWHPECLLGMPRAKYEPKVNGTTNGSLQAVTEETEDGAAPPTTNGTIEEQQRQQHADDQPLPPGFPEEDAFDHMICYKCVNAFPWIKAYAGSPGFLTAKTIPQTNGYTEPASAEAAPSSASLKRKAEDDVENSSSPKKAKSASPPATDGAVTESTEAPQAATNGAEGVAPPQTLLSSRPKHALLPPAPTGDHITLFLQEDFRDHFCRCPDCFPALANHDQLLEEEEAYEPPLSETESEHNSVAARSVNSGSLLDRGEAALSSMDRVKAIEGVMAYNHMKDKVKAFLQPFAESGQPVGAEDVKAYFAKLRGDELKEREAVVRAEQGSGSGGAGGRRGQEGY